MAPLIAPAAFRLPTDETLRARFGHITTWVFDLDNTLYPADSGIWPKIDERITLFLVNFSASMASRLAPCISTIILATGRL